MPAIRRNRPAANHRQMAAHKLAQAQESAAAAAGSKGNARLAALLSAHQTATVAATEAKDGDDMPTFQAAATVAQAAADAIQRLPRRAKANPPKEAHSAKADVELAAALRFDAAAHTAHSFGKPDQARPYHTAAAVSAALAAREGAYGDRPDLVSQAETLYREHAKALASGTAKANAAPSAASARARQGLLARMHKDGCNRFADKVRWVKRHMPGITEPKRFVAWATAAEPHAARANGSVDPLFWAGEIMDAATTTARAAHHGLHWDQDDGALTLNGYAVGALNADSSKTGRMTLTWLEFDADDNMIEREFHFGPARTPSAVTATIGALAEKLANLLNKRKAIGNGKHPSRSAAWANRGGQTPVTILANGSGARQRARGVRGVQPYSDQRDTAMTAIGRYRDKAKKALTPADRRKNAGEARDWIGIHKHYAAQWRELGRGVLPNGRVLTGDVAPDGTIGRMVKGPDGKRHRVRDHLTPAELAAPDWRRLRAEGVATIAAPPVPAPVAPPPAATPTEWRYGVMNRPASFGNVPTGMVRVDPPEATYPPHRARHGVAVYPHPLTVTDLQNWEMFALPTGMQLRELIDQWQADVRAYLIEYPTAPQYLVEEPTEIDHHLLGFLRDQHMAVAPSDADYMRLLAVAFAKDALQAPAPAARPAASAPVDAFLAAYRRELQSLYPWARDEDKLANFLQSARTTLTTKASVWNHDGPAVAAAWRAVGGKGTPTLKALRALAQA